MSDSKLFILGVYMLALHVSQSTALWPGSFIWSGRNVSR